MKTDNAPWREPSESDTEADVPVRVETLTGRIGRSALPWDQQRVDTELALEAHTALEWSPLVPEERVNVTVRSGEVTLDGEVDWRHQRDAAHRAVTGIQGVTAVTNAIRVKPRETALESRGDVLERATALS